MAIQKYALEMPQGHFTGAGAALLCKNFDTMDCPRQFFQLRTARYIYSRNKTPQTTSCWTGAPVRNEGFGCVRQPHVLGGLHHLHSQCKVECPTDRGIDHVLHIHIKVL